MDLQDFFPLLHLMKEKEVLLPEEESVSVDD